MTTTRKVQSSDLSLDVQPLINAVKEQVALSAAKERAIRMAFERILSAQLLKPAAAGRVRRSKSASKEAGEEMVLTTQQAADLVGVSRP